MPQYDMAVRHSIMLVVMLGSAACGSSSPSPTVDANLDTPRDTVTETKTLLVGDLAEGQFTGGPGDAVLIQLSTTTPTLAWDVHSHDGGETVVVIKEQDKSAVDYQLVPPTEGHWNLLIRNAGTTSIDIAVKLDLYGDIQWSDWN